MKTSKLQITEFLSSHGAIRAGLCVGALLCLFAAPASAGEIVQIRVGNHPTYTRLVFEMDASTGYQVETEIAEDGSKQVNVTVHASSRAREILSSSAGVESVSVADSSDTSVAHIQLRRSDVVMKEMILSNPPRIVIDFAFDPMVATTPEPVSYTHLTLPTIYSV